MSLCRWRTALKFNMGCRSAVQGWEAIWKQPEGSRWPEGGWLQLGPKLGAGHDGAWDPEAGLGCQLDGNADGGRDIRLAAPPPGGRLWTWRFGQVADWALRTRKRVGSSNPGRDLADRPPWLSPGCPNRRRGRAADSGCAACRPVGQRIQVELSSSASWLRPVRICCTAWS